MTRTGKIIILILVFLGLSLSVFTLSEEITAFKRMVYSCFREEATAETEEQDDSEEAAALAEMYDEFTPFTHVEDAWYQENRIVYHAGGGIEGITYTNSREAVEENLPKGNVLELDFFYTSDQHLVCIHSWDYITGSQEPMTAEEYRNYKIYGKYTTMDASDVVELMKNNPELYVIIDTKEADSVSVIRELINLAGDRTDVVDRYIIQLYDRGIKAQLMEIYPFAQDNFLFTCYKYGDNSAQILQICMEEEISVVTVGHNIWSADIIELFTGKGILIFEHTINRPDIMKNALERGVYGIYTDFLTSLEG